MEQDKLERISQLTALARTRELTLPEQEERAALRREYIAAMRGSLKATLDSTVIVDESGNRKKLRRNTSAET